MATRRHCKLNKKRKRNRKEKKRRNRNSYLKRKKILWRPYITIDRFNSISLVLPTATEQEVRDLLGIVMCLCVQDCVRTPNV